jgi:hypothetical protein
MCSFVFACSGPRLRWNEAAAHTGTYYFFNARFKKIHEKVQQIDFSVSKGKSRIEVWLNKFIHFYYVIT